MEKITKIIDWYENTTIKSVEDLMKARRALVAENARLALLAGEAAKDYRKSYVDRKLYFSREMQKTPKKMSNAASESLVQSSEKYGLLRMKEAEANGEKEASRLLFQAVDHVLKAMSQEIAEERDINKRIQVANK